MSKSSLQTDRVRDFVARAEHYRALLQETERTTELLSRVERGRGEVVPDDDETPRATYDKEYSETISVTGHVRRGLAGTGHAAKSS